MPTNRRFVILGSVVGSRLVYAISWFNLSPAFTALAQEFKIDLPSVGILTSAFVAGVGFFQVPAGIMAARWGSRNTSLLGLVIMGFADIGTGLSPNFPMLLMLRFLVGIGAAFFFAPAVGILLPFFKQEEQGLVLGLYNGAFNAGAGIGLFGWTLLTEQLGWRWSVQLAGIVTLILALENLIIIPDTQIRSRSYTTSLKAVFPSKVVWLLAIGLVGFWGAQFSTSTFLQEYAKRNLNAPAELAGLLASTMTFASLVGGPVGGALSDHFRRRKLFMIIPAAFVALALTLIGVTPLTLLWILVPAVGFVAAFVFASLYAGIAQYPQIGHTYAPLALGLVNSVQTLASSWVPVGFTLIAAATSFQYAWAFLGGVILAFIPALLFVPEPFHQRKGSPS